MGRISRNSANRALASALVLAAIVFASPAIAQTGHELGFDTTNFDKSVRPQDDFFRYVNGGWLKTHDIPADATSWGSFNELGERSRDALHTILEEASKSKAPAGSVEQKVGDLYASYMDTATVEKLGLKPLAGEMKTIAALETSRQLPATFAHFARIGVNTPIGVNVGQDPKRSDVNIVQVGQSGLGLPDRDYYLKNDAKMQETRAAYTKYITQLLTLAKQPDPAG